jgi:hypothetical protein
MIIYISRIAPLPVPLQAADLDLLIFLDMVWIVAVQDRIISFRSSPTLRIQFWEVKVRVSLVGSYTSSSLPALFYSLVLLVVAILSNGLSCTVPSCCSPYCQSS